MLNLQSHVILLLSTFDIAWKFHILKTAMPLKKQKSFVNNLRLDVGADLSPTDNKASKVDDIY